MEYENKIFTGTQIGFGTPRLDNNTENINFPLDTSYCDSKQIDIMVQNRKQEILNRIGNKQKDGLSIKPPSNFPVNFEEKRYKIQETINKIERENNIKHRKFLEDITECNLRARQDILENEKKIASIEPKFNSLRTGKLK